MNEMFNQCTVQDVFTDKTGYVSSAKLDDWRALLKIKDVGFLNVEIDTGARCNVLSKATAEKFQSISTITPSDVIINGISGKPMKAYGKVLLPCKYKDIERNIEFQVLGTQRNFNVLGR